MQKAAYVLIFLLFAGALSKLDFLWGINLWMFMGIPFILLITVAAILLISTKTFLSIDKFISKFSESRTAILISFIVFIILTLIFSQSVYFLGDGYLRIRNMEALQYYSSGSPLANYISIFIYEKIAYPNGISAETLWKFLSLLSGLGCMTYIFYYGSKLFADKKSLFYSALIILITPISQLYFGYIESYPPYYALLTGYYLSSLLMLKTYKFSLMPAVWIILAFMVSPTAVIFAPAVLYSYYKLASKTKRVEYSKIISPILLVVVITVLTGIILYALGFTPDEYKAGLTKVDHLLSIFPTESDQGILDITHLNDIINQLLLTAPGLILLIFPFNKLKDLKSNLNIFLILNFVAALIFMLTFRPDISFVRDWDLFSIAGLPLIFLMIVKYLVHDTKEEYGAYLVIVLGFLQFLPWIIINSNEKLSVKRMESISAIHYLPDYAKSNNYDILRQYYKGDIIIDDPSNFKIDDVSGQRLTKALHYTKLANQYRMNERYLYNISLYSYVLNQKDTAKKYLQQLIDMEYNQKHLAYALMSKIRIDEGDLISAIGYVKQIETIFPESESVKLDIAHLYYNAGEPRNSYEYFKKAYDINPKNESTLDYLIELSFICDVKESTLQYYREFDAVNPGNPATYYNMAICFRDLAQKDSMYQYIEKAGEAGISGDLLDELLNGANINNK
ncbi:MAG: hypothetical protein RBT61_07830 [Candidatus Kapabacteria bacterium]|nr:hypothetical protein [Candidatus Kapabacteria bacterium]